MEEKTTQMVPISPVGIAMIRAAVSSAQDYADASRAPATLRAYTRAWGRFALWCEKTGAPSLPTTSAVMAAYAGHLADQALKVPTIVQAMAAIGFEHTRTGHPSPRGPAVLQTMKGIRRRKRGNTPVRKAPTLAEHIRKMSDVLGGKLIDKRNRALILLGFSGAFRRSELVALDIADIEDAPEGFRVHIRHSKTDGFGKGFIKGIPYGSNTQTCPVQAVRAWIDASGISEGALFVGVNRHGGLTCKRLHGADVARIVKQTIGRIGTNPALYSGHSLRAGLVTASHQAGKSIRSIMDQTGHVNVQTVYAYIRYADIFKDNAFSGLGL